MMASYMTKPTLQAEMAAEFLGTLLLIALGCGVVASAELFENKGSFLGINFAWGIAVALAVAVSGRVSGAHLNPAVTVTVALFRGFPWAKVVPYSLAQIAGAFVGAALVYLNYRPAFLKADPLLEKTAGVFATFPAFPESLASGLIDQVLGTALLLVFVFALTDELNYPPNPLVPAMIGLVVVAIGASFGAMHGYAINPARDFGPRLLATVAGFRNNGLTDGTGVFLIPIAGPLLGGPIGGLIYNVLIRPGLPPKLQ